MCFTYNASSNGMVTCKYVERNCRNLFNPLRPSGNYKSQLSLQSVPLYFVFMGSVTGIDRTNSGKEDDGVLHKETRVYPRGSPFAFCGRKSGTGKGFSQISLVFKSQIS